MTSKVMLNYIKETPAAIEKLIGVFKKKYSAIDLPKVNNVVFIGSGSSFNTAHQVSPFYENYLNLNTRIFHPDTFLSLNKLNMDKNKTIVIGISETGTSTGTNKAFEKARKEGFKTISLTQKINTPLSVKGNYYFNFCSGDENCNAKTKGYTNNLVLLYLLGPKLAKIEFNINDLINEIEAEKEEIKRNILNFPNWFDHNHNLVRMNNFLVVGAEPYAGATEEAALKISETMLIQSSFTSAEEFPHGYHRTINENSTVFFINNENYPLEKTMQYFKSKVNHEILIDTTENENGDFNVELRKYYLQSLTIGVLFQLLAYYLPTYLGLDPNREANDKYDELVDNRLS